MAVIVLFHSVLGLRDLEHGLARDWRAAGHDVVLGDLFEGHRSEDYDEGFAALEAVGFERVQARARALADTAPRDAVLAGISMGAGLATHIWASRPDTRGVLLLAGMAPWPDKVSPGIPVAVHAAQPDPFDDEAAFDAFAAKAPDVRLAIHRYPDVGHLFLDPASPEHDEAADTACRDRCLGFLAGL